jgi:hypothetical protein
MSDRPSIVGPVLTSIICLGVGTRLLITGRGGYRAGFGDGLHIKVGGAVLLIAAIGLAAVAFKRTKQRNSVGAESNGSSEPER